MDILNEKTITDMYVNKKLSVAQINELTHVSIWKILRTLERNNILKRSISEAITQVNITKFHKVPFRLKTELSLEENNLKITGIMLYWGEGAKTQGAVNFSNSNPERMDFSSCRSSLMVKQRFCKAKSGGPIPLSGSYRQDRKVVHFCV